MKIESEEPPIGLSESFGKCRLSRVALWLIILAIIVGILVNGKKLLVPFVIALVFSYIIKALYDWIGKYKIWGRALPKWIRASLSLVIIMGLLFGIGEILTYNIELMIQAWPQYQHNIRSFVHQVEDVFGIDNLADNLRDRFQDFDLRPILTQFVSSATAAIGNVFIIIIYVLFLILENAVFGEKLKAIHRGKPEMYDRIVKLLFHIHRRISDYLTLKTIVSAITGVLSYFILIFIGVDFPMFWAFLIFILNFIPNTT